MAFLRGMTPAIILTHRAYFLAHRGRINFSNSQGPKAILLGPPPSRADAHFTSKWNSEKRSHCARTCLRGSDPCENSNAPKYFGPSGSQQLSQFPRGKSDFISPLGGESCRKYFYPPNHRHYRQQRTCLTYKGLVWLTRQPPPDEYSQIQARGKVLFQDKIISPTKSREREVEPTHFWICIDTPSATQE